MMPYIRGGLKEPSDLANGLFRKPQNVCASQNVSRCYTAQGQAPYDRIHRRSTVLIAAHRKASGQIRLNGRADVGDDHLMLHRNTGGKSQHISRECKSKELARDQGRPSVCILGAANRRNRNLELALENLYQALASFLTADGRAKERAQFPAGRRLFPPGQKMPRQVCPEVILWKASQIR
ncbi:hypothetical protein SAMN02927914_04534 [Mesorhizobium qingshengii]|uniref:Uncharacterized protein n=1 Tax=Mesorhizobium qingshengii TaxID=1165689 RepID=A0A1G5ZAI8_9HYPH|nr:hypothetical protein SAMN02927914_04534 [Mesorhizobium qingshengii]